MPYTREMTEYILITPQVVAKNRQCSHFLDNQLVQKYAKIMGIEPIHTTRMGRTGGTFLHHELMPMFEEWLESEGDLVSRTALVLKWRTAIKSKIKELECQ